MRLTNRYREALDWMFVLYQDDIRKSSGAPGLHHPMGVSELVMGAGGDEDTALGALFHDLGEDKGGEKILLEIRDRFGERVERIVRDCSDTLPTEYSIKEPWINRKVAHIKHIPGLEADSQMVLAADTLHNCRDHIQGFRAYGEGWWKNFRANVYSNRPLDCDICAASTLWYLRAKSSALLRASNKIAIDGRSILPIELSRTVQSFNEMLPLYIQTTCVSMASEHVAHMYGKL